MVILLSHAEDRHDIGMMQLGGGFGLALESPHLLGVEQRAGREHLECDSPAQRFLLGLVDHAHAAATDLAEDPVVAQPLDSHAYRRAVVRGERAGSVARALAEVFHHEQRREEVADVFGEIRVAFNVLAKRRLLTAAFAIEKLLGKGLDRVARR